jgi:hypothetical protein
MYRNELNMTQIEHEDQVQPVLVHSRILILLQRKEIHGRMLALNIHHPLKLLQLADRHRRPHPQTVLDDMRNSQHQTRLPHLHTKQHKTGLEQEKRRSSMHGQI